MEGGGETAAPAPWACVGDGLVVSLGLSGGDDDKALTDRLPSLTVFFSLFLFFFFLARISTVLELAMQARLPLCL